MATKANSEDRIVESLSDKCSRDILGLTSKKEYSALELSNELNIPLSTIYRKLKLLEGSGLIQHVKTIINPAVNEEKYYRCEIREAAVSFTLRSMGYDTSNPEGGSYVIVRSPILDDVAFMLTLARYNIFCIPGTLMDIPGYFRISLTANDEIIERALSGFAQSLRTARL